MTTKYIVKVIPAQNRTWKTIEDILQAFTKQDVVEMVHRYQDAQDHAIKYRQNAQAKNKMMKARLAMLEAKMASMGQMGQDDQDDEDLDQQDQ